ncbi:hypothetical protein MNBD_CHLOROFLEXI01-3152 [hydrothermal vent metagenome]|uniref:Uncharacterized protein n=1 Tax=hydrothermal vent metagenome TaxID=652676 RepID=A0A3B0VPF8_9ZZZZ
MLKARKRFAHYLHRCYSDRSTLKHYLNDVDLFVRQVGDKSSESVSIKDVDDYIDSQMEKQLKPATINRRIASLHTFFEYLASEEPDKAWPNPVNRRRHCLKQGQSLPRDASEAEVNTLFGVIDDPRDRAMLGLMVGAGLRVGEVVTLSCDHLEAPPLPRQMARLRVVGKGRKERIAWITPYWYETVSQWLAIRAPAKTNALFLNQHQRLLSVAGVQYRFKRYCKEAGIHLTCHQLRHTFARRLAEQRMPTESIGQLLGHAQLKTTQLYTAGANPDLGDEFLETMNRLETATLVETTPISAIPLAPAQEEVADLQALEQAIARLQTLPDWLQGTLALYLPADEYERLLKTVLEQAASLTPRHVLDRAWFLTLAHTGIRSCELLNLRLHDVDFASKRLIVRGSKNYRDRVVFLTPTLTAALANYLALRPAVEDDHFWIDNDNVLTSARIGYPVHRWGQAAKVAVSPHRLRHTLATQLVNQGMPLPSVGKLLGHRSLNTTQHYARLFEQTVKEQFEAAIAHIEGIAATTWPQARGEPSRTILQKDPEFVEHIIDSV